MDLGLRFFFLFCQIEKCPCCFVKLIGQVGHTNGFLALLRFNSSPWCLDEYINNGSGGADLPEKHKNVLDLNSVRYRTSVSSDIFRIDTYDKTFIVIVAL